jgi:D-glycero-D-manno-heptose 1,7-bisphosphate phosphatase
MSPAAACSAVFLDRDGVIIEDDGYVGRAADVRMIPGAADAVARLNRAGLAVVVVTNQSGIGRGYYSWADFEAVQAAIEAELARANARLDLVLACAYHADALPPLAVSDHPWRKPNPGMILAAAREVPLQLHRCVIVGDRLSDLEAGRRAGLGRGILVRTGNGRREEAAISEQRDAAFSCSLADALPQAVDFIEQQLRAGGG